HDAGEDGVLAGLDPDQRAAAEVPGGPLLIVAGPGTGKTRTVTHRIAHLVLERDVPARQCLAITFTRRAAEEMTERLHALVGAKARDITVATFHSLGLAVLRERHARLELPADFGVADAAEQHRVLTEVAGDERAARRLRSAISRARRGGAQDGSGETDTPDADVADTVPRYLAALRERGLVDYDDLLALPVELLESDADAREEYRRRFQWITVDEYQDVDDLQYRLLRLLAPGEANLTAIGDPDQAIYAFRGADVRFFLRFQQDYPQAPVVQLTRNYRSGRHILAGALKAIRPGTLVADRQLHPTRDDSAQRITLHRAADERAEAAFVARTIDRLLGGTSLHSLDSGRVQGDGDGRIGFSDIAVLYRTDAQSRALLEELGRCGFPAQKRSHDPLTARSGVEHILRELTHTSAASAPGETPVVERVRAAAGAILASLPDGRREERAAELRTAVELLTPLAHRCGTDLARFCQEVLLGAEVDALDPRADAVSLLTLHAAKGLEFPVVFVTGCEDTLLPLRWPGTEPDEAALAEERRLCFVGMTRAQDHLYLTHAAKRTRRGEARETRPSPFLTEVRELSEAVTTESAPPRPRRRAQQLSLL
uniref:ATP-dependent helicase n=1 Tax=Allosalinactinospora lopnorensis TaxID=1352348 RepID=UPI000623F729